MTNIAPHNTSGRTQSGTGKNAFNQERDSAASGLADGAAEAASGAIDKGRQLAALAGEQAKEASDRLASRIKRNPLSAIGIAFGAAFGIGAMFAMLRK